MIITVKYDDVISYFNRQFDMKPARQSESHRRYIVTGVFALRKSMRILNDFMTARIDKSTRTSLRK